jgi:ubiquinone/menaquinone biosynthesis C-methylase UbiE
MENLDPKTVEGFGVEWSRFNQSGVSEPELRRMWDNYFHIFPWDRLASGAIGFDAGCGSGRWARYVSERVGTLHCVDASDAALAVARSNLADRPNCHFHHASLAEMPFADGSMDFGYSLGVLHHVPDTSAALRACVRKLKPAAPLLVYLYYSFDNRPPWYSWLWRASNLMRRGISTFPRPAKVVAADLLAGSIYWPLARIAALAERCGVSPQPMPLAFYRKASFYTMRTDALDRFGTRLEQRFSADQIRSMLHEAGLENIRFSDRPPYWCAVGVRRTPAAEATAGGRSASTAASSGAATSTE